MRESNTYSIYEAISFYRCIACNREIYLDKRIVDNKGRMIAVERFSPQQHRCPWEAAQEMQSLDLGGQDDIKTAYVFKGSATSKVCGAQQGPQNRRSKL